MLMSEFEKMDDADACDCRQSSAMDWKKSPRDHAAVLKGEDGHSPYAREVSAATNAGFASSHAPFPATGVAAPGARRLAAPNGKSSRRTPRLAGAVLPPSPAGLLGGVVAVGAPR